MYTVRIDEFEGPLDLLLHLIKESKMDLLDLKIEVIVDEYLEYIHQMEQMNLEIASSYLVMASELVEMKSKLLLPRVEDAIEEGEEEDSKEALVQRLIEYQKYKDLTSKFRMLEEARKEIYTKAPNDYKEFVDQSTYLNNSNVTLDDLLDAFQKFLDRKKLEAPLNTKVTKKEITVEERRTSIKKLLTQRKKVSFLELFDCVTKEYVVVTFLAILEMAKQKEISLVQEKSFGDIICEVVS